MTAREATLWLKSAHTIAELQQMNFFDLRSFLMEVQSGIGRNTLPQECIAFSEHVDTVAITADQLETGYNFLCRLGLGLGLVACSHKTFEPGRLFASR